MHLNAIPNLLSIDSTFFELLNYRVSYLEFVGTTTGLVSVYLAARSNIWTWATGLVNVACFFLIFHQVQLYSDMFLQAYFFAASIYGWTIWNRQDRTGLNPIKLLSYRHRIITLLLITVSTGAIGTVISNLHRLLPSVFEKPASYPFLDTFIAVLSVLATLLLARRLLENWILWIVVDVLSTGLYAVKGVRLIAIEYFIFLCIAISGLYHWHRLSRNENRLGSG
jgi:nicotinamide mononucleotide transporter